MQSHCSRSPKLEEGEPSSTLPLEGEKSPSSLQIELVERFQAILGSKIPGIKVTHVHLNETKDATQ